MTKFRISPFLNNSKFSLEIEEFEPRCGYKIFLADACKFFGEQLLDWYQGVESGVGHMTYKSELITVSWTDFPIALSFDCANEEIANELRTKFDEYFKVCEIPLIYR